MAQPKPSEDPCVVYADIIHLPHHQSDTHSHMSLYDRAAQFAPFAALRGYDEMVAEETRQTDDGLHLSPEELELLNQKLTLIGDVVEDGFHPQLTFRVFVPDDRKAGGSYRSVTDAVKKVDIISRKLVLMGTEGRGRVNKTIDFDRIAAIHGALVDYMDDGIE